MKRLSERKPEKKIRKVQTTRLDKELVLFHRWLRAEGVNISEFTRALWRYSPEFKDFKAIKDKDWLEEE